MSGVSGLAYIGYDVTDARAWDEMLREVYGLELRADGGKGVRRYRLDDRHHRIGVHAARRDGIRYIGWEAPSRLAFETIARRLADLGVRVRRGTPAQLAERAVLDLVAFEDPDGFPLEVCYGAVTDNTPFRPSRGLSGFKTGEQGLGHIVIFARDPAASVAWYEDVLGFRLSDYIHWAEARATFLHCNPRHHSLAILNECFGAKGGDFHHLMLEAASLDDVGRAFDIVEERGLPVAFTLGRHTNDRMTSFYLYTPSGHTIEYGYGGIAIDDATWVPTLYDSTRYWGHQHRPPPADKG